MIRRCSIHARFVGRSCTCRPCCCFALDLESTCEKLDGDGVVWRFGTCVLCVQMQVRLRLDLSIRPTKGHNCTGAKGGLFQTLSERISQLFSPLRSIARWRCFVKFRTRLTPPKITVLLVSFFGFQEITFLTRQCVFVKSKTPLEICDVQTSTRKGPLFGEMAIRSCLDGNSC